MTKGKGVFLAPRIIFPVPNYSLLDWSKVAAFPAIMEITCRTSNRFYVGLPICRDPEYRKLTIDFTVELVKTATIIGLFPEFLKPYVKVLLASLLLK